jgi:hypothetical protein
VNEHDAVIVVRVPPQRLRWLAAELRDAGIAYQVERAGREYHVQTTAAAAPQLHRVLDAKPQRARTFGSPKAWLIGGAVVAVGLTAYNLSIWGRHELTVPRLLGWDAMTTAGAFLAFVALALVWFKLATGPAPAGYRKLVPDWLAGLLVLAGAALAAWAIATGRLY